MAAWAENYKSPAVIGLDKKYPRALEALGWYSGGESRTRTADTRIMIPLL